MLFFDLLTFEVFFFSCRDKLSSGKTVAMQLACTVAEIHLSSSVNKIQQRYKAIPHLSQSLALFQTLVAEALD